MYLLPAAVTALPLADFSANSACVLKLLHVKPQEFFKKKATRRGPSKVLAARLKVINSHRLLGKETRKQRKRMVSHAAAVEAYRVCSGSLWCLQLRR